MKFISFFACINILLSSIPLLSTVNKHIRPPIKGTARTVNNQIKKIIGTYEAKYGVSVAPLTRTLLELRLHSLIIATVIKKNE